MTSMHNLQHGCYGPSDLLHNHSESVLFSKRVRIALCLSTECAIPRPMSVASFFGREYQYHNRQPLYILSLKNRHSPLAPFSISPQCFFIASREIRNMTDNLLWYLTGIRNLSEVKGSWHSGKDRQRIYNITVDCIPS